VKPAPTHRNRQSRLRHTAKTQPGGMSRLGKPINVVTSRRSRPPPTTNTCMFAVGREDPARFSNHRRPLRGESLATDPTTNDTGRELPKAGESTGVSRYHSNHGLCTPRKLVPVPIHAFVNRRGGFDTTNSGLPEGSSGSGKTGGVPRARCCRFGPGGHHFTGRPRSRRFTLQMAIEYESVTRRQSGRL